MKAGRCPGEASPSHGGGQPNERSSARQVKSDVGLASLAAGWPRPGRRLVTRPGWSESAATQVPVTRTPSRKLASDALESYYWAV